MINLKNFESNLLKIDKKSYKNIDIYNIGYITIKKIDDCESIYSVYPLQLRDNHAKGYIDEKNENNCLIVDSPDENKELLKNTQMLGKKLKTKSMQKMLVIIIMKKILRKVNLILMMTYH